MHADRFNRFALILFGLLLAVAGAAGLVASAGGFGHRFASHTLFANQVSSYIGTNGTWVWAVAAAVGAVLALAVVRWILVLLISTDRAGTITLPGGREHGVTQLQPTALTGALTREIQAYHGVASAKGRLIGDAASPRLVLTVTAAPTTDLPTLHHRLHDQALAHARQALGNTSLPIQLDLDVSR